jgi:hypothetical protein
MLLWELTGLYEGVGTSPMWDGTKRSPVQGSSGVCTIAAALAYENRYQPDYDGFSFRVSRMIVFAHSRAPERA